MKKLTLITLVLLILLTGCSKADKTDVAMDTGEIILNEKDRSQLSLETEPIVEDTDDTISFSAGKDESITADDTTTEKTSDTTKSTVSTTKIPATDTVKSETTKNTDKPKDTKVPENTTKAVETTFPKETAPPPVTSEHIKETAPPETTKPAETTTVVETEPPTAKSAYDMPFDIEQIRSDLISYGQSLGFRHRTSYKDGTVVTPDNSSWEMPIVASSSFSSESLKRSLYDYVSSYVEYEIYGGEPVADFTIYIRSISGGYEIYFLH